MAEELERSLNTIVCKMTWTARATCSPQQPKNLLIVGPHMKPQAPKFSHAFREVGNRQAVHHELTVADKQALQRTLEVKRKATELQEQMAIRKERTRRTMNEHARAEGHVNDSIGSLGNSLQAAARATHSLTCGVPDRESIKVKCMREATNSSRNGNSASKVGNE